jgi:hypothetical protein
VTAKSAEKRARSLAGRGGETAIFGRVVGDGERQPLWRKRLTNYQTRLTAATPNDSTSSMVHRREYYLASVHMKLVIFSLFLCSSAECYALFMQRRCVAADSGLSTGLSITCVAPREFMRARNNIHTFFFKKRPESRKPVLSFPPRLRL